MNRESALLGVPTFSIFTGPRPYLDEYLQWGNKLKFIQTIDEVRSIPLAKRSVQAGYTPENTELASTVTDILVDTGNTLAP